MKRKPEHNVSDSDDDSDGDIKKIAESHLKTENEEMSDFSIGSPKKKQRVETTSSKKMSHSAITNGGENTSSSPRKHSAKLPDKSRKGGKMKNKRLRYKVLEGFEETAILDSDVLGEDVQDKEMWLIKAPLNFDIKKLNGVDINLKGCTELRDNEDDFYEVTGARDKTGELQQFSAIFPSEEKSPLMLGPNFKGQIHVMQSLEVPELPPIIMPEPVVHKIPDGLFPRFEPFGSEKPVQLRGKSPKVKTLSSDDELKNSAKKKKKKKKLH